MQSSGKSQVLKKLCSATKWFLCTKICVSCGCQILGYEEKKDDWLSVLRSSLNQFMDRLFV